MPNPARLSGVRTRGSTNKRPLSDSMGDSSRTTLSRPNNTASYTGADTSRDSKRSRLSFGHPQAPPKERRDPPCRLCEELCEKTISAQQQDIRSLQIENTRLEENLKRTQSEVHLLHAAFLADHPSMAAALDQCQEKLQRLQMSFMNFLDQSQLQNARSDSPQAFAAKDSTWTQERAPAAVAESTANLNTYDGDLFAIHHGNLFDLEQIPPISLNADEYET